MMIKTLFVILLLSSGFAYRLSGKNVLSAWVIAHAVYIFSTGILLLNFDNLQYDISWSTIIVILGSIYFIGVGELYARNAYFKKHKTVYYPKFEELPQIQVSTLKFVLSIIAVAGLLMFNYYKFNVVGSFLGGVDFASKYLLIRSLIVDNENGVRHSSVSVPFETPMLYFRFFVEILVYFYFFLYLYNRNFGIKNYKRPNICNLFPLCIYFFICLLLTNRSEFIRVFSVTGIMTFIIQKQSTHGWKDGKSNRRILRSGVVIILLFYLLFSSVGSLKGQNIDENNFISIACSYTGASIIGLDKYLNGKIKSESEYVGQETFMNFYSVLNRLGADFKMKPYHQEFFVWGKGGEETNLFSSPFYFLIDFPFLVVLFIYFLIGLLLGYLMYSIKFGVIKVFNWGFYIMISILYNPIVTISITESMHHYLGTVFIYQLFSIYIIKRFIVKVKVK